jgi:branched-chain amino acid transport system substrate-binding protein
VTALAVHATLATSDRSKSVQAVTMTANPSAENRLPRTARHWRGIHRCALAIALFAAAFTAATAVEHPVVIGALYNLTGGQQDLDIPSSRGAKLAVNEANKAGDVLGRPVKLILVDGKTNPGVIARATLGLLRQQPSPAGLIGFSDTDMVLAAARIAAVHSEVFITSGATSPKLPQEVPSFLFLACFGDNVQAAAGAEWAVETLKARTAVVLYNQTSTYAKLLHGYFQTRFEQLGGKVLTVRAYTLKTIKDAAKGLPKADLVYFAAQPDDVIAGIAALRGAGITAPILGGDGLDIGAAWQKAVRADKIYFTTHAYLGADNPDPRVKAFRAVYAKAYPGQQADAFAALGYDTARLLMTAIKSAGSTEPQAVRKALAATHDFAGVTGTISYRNGSRIPVKSVSIIAVTKGRQSLAVSVLPRKIPAP